MYEGYEPGFYVSCGAADNTYYFTGNGNYENAKRISDAEAVIPCGATVKVEYEGLPGGCVRQRTVLKNTTDAPLTVELLGASFTAGIGRTGSRPWKKHRFVVNYAQSGWCGEAQWRHAYAEDAGLYRTYNHGSQTSFRIASQSSWSTCRFEPVVMVEDTEQNETYFAQIEAGHGWMINVGIRGYRDDIELCILTTDCAERNDGWHVKLQPGETVRSCYCTVGRVNGGFEAAAAALTAARRASFLTRFEGGVPPLCFNDYMNCLWALPTREKTMPLVEAAAKIGCEYYVIDAGWYGVCRDEERDLGMWAVDDSVFGPRGLQGIFDDIAARGMKPGIWFEFESAGIESAIVKEHPEYILYRHGSPVGGRRVLLDFRQKGVRDHLQSRVQCLYDMGVRYIKNDYNANTGPGIDPDGARSLHEHSRAFEDFIDGLRRRFPDLLIENCGSGAMRSDAGTLSHFHLQSVSDQEDYFRLPSIVSGSAACFPPERCGVWAYPYPVKIDYRTTFEPNGVHTGRFADGKVTVYTAVTGLMGLMYLSGHIDCADEYNMRLLCEAARLYKKYRAVTAAAVPVYPTGTFDIDSEGVETFGLLDKGTSTLMLAVWNNSADSAGTDIDLCRYAPGGDVAEVFPKTEGYGAGIRDGVLHVSLPGGRSALYAVIKY